MNQPTIENHTDDEVLSAFIDGELNAVDADRLTERLAREPALLKRLEALRSSDEATRAMYAAVDQQPIPQAIMDLLQTDAPLTSGVPDNVVAFPPQGWRRFSQAPVAIAASVALVAGFLMSRVIDNAPDETAAVSALYAQTIPPNSDVFRLLENSVSADEVAFPDGSDGRIILSFADSNGDWCRQLAINSTVASVNALACRRNGQWHTEAVSYGSASSSNYQQASGSQSAAIAALVDQLIGDNDVLEKEQEQDAIARQWQ